MLSLLHIENIAVIEKADIEFEQGLNVLTGETGAGKSIVIDAIGAVTGERTSREIVRTGAEKAFVSASFYAPGAASWLSENGIEPEDDIILSRSISAEGKNVCRVNGAPVSVAQLRSIGSLLLDIHGQNDGRSLLDESTHRAYLDAYGGLGESVENYTKEYSAYKELLRQRDALQMDESEKLRRTDMLRFRLEELSSAGLKPGEEERLAARRELLRHAEKLIESTNEAYAALYGSDSERGAADLIGEAEGAMRYAARLSEDFSGCADALAQLRYEAEDALEKVREMRDALDFSPGELDETERRLSLLQRLSKKYGGGSEQLLELLESTKKELDDIEYSDERLKKIEAELERQQSRTAAAAKSLSEERKKAATELKKRMEKELSELSMPSARFQAEFLPVSAECSFNASGCDEIRFLISANAGEEPGRISRIASGGELSRIMLAMKTVLCAGDGTGTLIFDEIDSGVSGIAAQRVGEKLAALSARKQVLCVTHLPQIAAMADTHFGIEKKEAAGRTATSVTRLDDERRKYEIARLYGGENITFTTLAGAEEQLAAAREYKRRERK